MNSAPDVILLTMEARMSRHQFSSLLGARTQSATHRCRGGRSFQRREIDKLLSWPTPLVEECRCRDGAMTVLGPGAASNYRRALCPQARLVRCRAKPPA